MFNKDKYLTKGIKERIPTMLMLQMWSMIQEIPDDKRDYLQVFNLTWENGNLTIEHTQETPEYKNTITYANKDREYGTEKIFVIDDGDYSTMLLAEEY